MWGSSTTSRGSRTSLRRTTCGCMSTAPTGSPRWRPTARGFLFSGIHRADSFSVDPHKWLFAPFDCAALLYRDPDLARQAHTQHAAYLEVLQVGPDWNPSDYAFHLSRRAAGSRSGSRSRPMAPTRTARRSRRRSSSRGDRAAHRGQSACRAPRSSPSCRSWCSVASGGRRRTMRPGPTVCSPRDSRSRCRRPGAARRASGSASSIPARRSMTSRSSSPR